MRILLDGCVWGGALEPLRAQGHDVEWAGDRAEDPGDPEILARAGRKRRILVTLDKDFGEIAVVRGVRHSGIVRVVDHPVRELARPIGLAVERYGPELLAGAIVTAEPTRFRVRPAAEDAGDLEP